MCYSNCKYENWDGECTKSRKVPYDYECHCFEEEGDEDEEEEEED